MINLGTKGFFSRAAEGIFITYKHFKTLAKLAKSTVNFNFAKRYFKNLADIQKT